MRPGVIADTGRSKLPDESKWGSALAGALQLNGMVWGLSNARAAHETKTVQRGAGGLRRSLSSTYTRCLGVIVSPLPPFLIFRPLPLRLHRRSTESEHHRKT